MEAASCGPDLILHQGVVVCRYALRHFERSPADWVTDACFKMRQTLPGK
jgi:hypothetical protein